MRISDWSSDVCSSDLAQPAQEAENDDAACLQIEDAFTIVPPIIVHALKKHAVQFGRKLVLGQFFRKFQQVRVRIELTESFLAQLPLLASRLLAPLGILCLPGLRRFSPFSRF